MKRNEVFALALIALSIVAVFFLTKQPKSPDILASLDKTNYGANTPKANGASSLISTVLPFLL